MMLLRQQQLAQQQAMANKRGLRPKKKSVGKKPPLGAGMRDAGQRPFTATNARKPRRQGKMMGINTISHDDENRNPNSRQVTEGLMIRKNNS